MLSTLMRAVIACSKVGSGVQLHIEVVSSSCSNDGLQMSSDLDLLPMDCSGKEVGGRLIGNSMQVAEIREVSEPAWCCGFWLGWRFLGW